ncbi:MAG: OsmC family protein [Gemmatimonadaceae bacterium]|jgi:putative redox protein|nr:OsmC family protein [Gemmatimonadaceae bacterium]
MTAPHAGKPPSRVEVVWGGDQRFDVSRPGGSVSRLDGRGETGPSPVDGLVGALAACTAVDVTMILEKRRTPVRALRIEATGARADAVPARVTAVDLVYHLDGDGIDRANAERAVHLAVTKYCSVRDSLDPALPIHYTVILNGEAGTRLLGA